MKITVDIDEKAYADMRKAIRLMAPKLQQKVYVDGFKAAGAYVKRRARAAAPNRKGARFTRAGTFRARLRDSFNVKAVAWHWEGKRVPKSAVVVDNRAPHFYFVEEGTVRTRARPMIGPVIRQTSALIAEFKKGVNRSYKRTVKRLAAQGGS